MEPVSAVVSPSPTGRTAFQTGLIFGAAQAVIACSVLFINAYASPPVGLSLLLSVISFLTGLAAYFVSGILAARKNGKVRTGTFAGMWTGGMYGVIGLIVSLGLFFQVSYPKLVEAAESSGLYTNTMETYKTAAMIGGVGAAIFGFLFAIGLGAGLGALGGLIGRNISPFKPLPLVPVFAAYPGQPYVPGQPLPVAPGQPYAPGQPMPVALGQPYVSGQPMPVVPGQPLPYAPVQPAAPSPAPASEQVFPEQPVNPYAVQPPMEQQQQ